MLLQRGIYLRNSVIGKGSSCRKQYLNGHAKTLENLKSIKSLQKSGKTDVVSVFFVGNSRCRGCFRPFLCNCMCFACKPRVSWAFVFYVRCCLFLQKFALATSKTVLQVVRIQSLENYGKTSFSRMIQVSNCNKRVQKNSRMFGCLVSFIFICSVRTA